MAANLSAAAEAEAPLPDSAAATRYNWPALVFGVLLIVVIICGNLLVCLSVFTEKALKTTTNYFIVSLAVADLMLAVLVLPLFVFSEFQDGVWTLSTTICDGLMTMDVMLCTASIFNLCAISIDRFIAVLIPLNYNRKHVDLRQTVLLSATWILALAVASPVMFGINNVPGRDPGECKLENNNYVLYSSVCSFFIPCPIMLLLYCGMFRGLRRWEEARKAKLRNSIQACRKLQEAAASLPPLASLPPPLPPIIERELTDTPDEPSTFPSTDRPFHSEYKDGPVRTVSFAEIRFNPDPHRRKRAKINSRERKAMKVLPVVVVRLIPGYRPNDGKVAAKKTRHVDKTGETVVTSRHQAKAGQTRCLPVLLDSLLCPAHNASSLSGLPRPTGPDERGDVARVRQQCSEPRHLHCLQHRVQELLQKVSAPLLLLELQRYRCMDHF
ncbi:D(4) dopamine receptor isoform X1 [Seriola lalandi dorsalis]|uniref:D(4) dopamine receptor isoform X1 n=1 Tax=Seriola lalandi dorsalis TaxID=1841481 RepID=UPI000C6FAD95|nr:D(4) dopamine receptor isoform X1 [Seriola lalandi dorsalis]